MVFQEGNCTILTKMVVFTPPPSFLLFKSSKMSVCLNDGENKSAFLIGIFTTPKWNQCIRTRKV